MSRAEARLDIMELSARYMRGLDRLDRASIAQVFWPEAHLEYGIYDGGPEAFVDFALGALASHEANHHMLGQILVEFEGDGAFGEVYYQAYHRTRDTAGDKRDLFISGRYVDRYEVRDGVWKIAYRSELVDWVREEAAADAWFEGSAMLPGRRKPDDPIYHRARMGPR